MVLCVAGGWRVVLCVAGGWRVVLCVAGGWRVVLCVAGGWRVVVCRAELESGGVQSCKHVYYSIVAKYIRIYTYWRTTHIQD